MKKKITRKLAAKPAPAAKPETVNREPEVWKKCRALEVGHKSCQCADCLEARQH